MESRLFGRNQLSRVRLRLRLFIVFGAFGSRVYAVVAHTDAIRPGIVVIVVVAEICPEDVLRRLPGFEQIIADDGLMEPHIFGVGTDGNAIARTRQLDRFDLLAPLNPGFCALANDFAGGFVAEAARHPVTMRGTSRSPPVHRPAYWGSRSSWQMNRR